MLLKPRPSGSCQMGPISQDKLCDTFTSSCLAYLTMLRGVMTGNPHLLIGTRFTAPLRFPFTRFYCTVHFRQWRQKFIAIKKSNYLNGANSCVQWLGHLLGKPLSTKTAKLIRRFHQLLLRRWHMLLPFNG